MQESFKNKAVAINEISHKKISIIQSKIAFKKGFEEGLDIELEPYQLSVGEFEQVHKKAKERYENDEWNFMR